MKRALCRLRAASKSVVPGHGVTRDLPYVCKPSACSKSEAHRGVSCIRSGAYVVWAFSGVKDARSESFLADASASAALLAVSEQIDNKQATKGQQEENARTALRQHEDNSGRAQ